MLTAGEMRIRKDDRFDLEGTNLRINSVDVDDDGEYTCEIEADREYPVVIKHKVQVLSKCHNIRYFTTAIGTNEYCYVGPLTYFQTDMYDQLLIMFIRLYEAPTDTCLIVSASIFLPVNK